jgi:hypothetical protein
MTPYPPPYAHCIGAYVYTCTVQYSYTVFLFTQGRREGGELTREKVREAIVHEAGQKYQQD